MYGVIKDASESKIQRNCTNPAVFVTSLFGNKNMKEVAVRVEYRV